MGQEARGGGRTEASAWCSDGQRSSQGCGSSVVLTKDKAVVHRNNFVSFGNLQLGFWSSVTTCSKKKVHIEPKREADSPWLTARRRLCSLALPWHIDAVTSSSLYLGCGCCVLTHLGCLL